MANKKENMVKIPIGNPQTPKDYLVVRIQLVHIRKGLFGLRDTILSGNALIADTRKKACDIYGEVDQLFKKYGVVIHG